MLLCAAAPPSVSSRLANLRRNPKPARVMSAPDCNSQAKKSVRSKGKAHGQAAFISGQSALRSIALPFERAHVAALVNLILPDVGSALVGRQRVAIAIAQPPGLPASIVRLLEPNRLGRAPCSLTFRVGDLCCSYPVLLNRRYRRAQVVTVGTYRTSRQFPPELLG